NNGHETNAHLLSSLSTRPDDLHSHAQHDCHRHAKHNPSASVMHHSGIQGSRRTEQSSTEVQVPTSLALLFRNAAFYRFLLCKFNEKAVQYRAIVRHLLYLNRRTIRAA